MEVAQTPLPQEALSSGIFLFSPLGGRFPRTCIATRGLDTSASSRTGHPHPDEWIPASHSFICPTHWDHAPFLGQALCQTQEHHGGCNRRGPSCHGNPFLARRLASVSTRINYQGHNTWGESTRLGGHRGAWSEEPNVRLGGQKPEEVE